MNDDGKSKNDIEAKAEESDSTKNKIENYSEDDISIIEKPNSEEISEPEKSKNNTFSDTDSFKSQLNNIQDNVSNLLNEFQSKLKYDQHKEKIIDNLHRELQEYKNDLTKKLLQPIIMDIISAIDDIKKLVQHYRLNDPSELDPLKLLDLMESLPSDLEDILYRQKVETFNCTEKVFNPSLQKAIKILETDDETKDKIISKILRSGYEWEGKKLLPELVEVYIHSKDTVNIEKGEQKDE